MSGQTQTHDEYLTGGYLPQLDVLRALSVLAVVAFHTHGDPVPWINGGRTGVQAFFVLSGYLITTLCVREESRTGSVDLRGFYLRRSFRIFPLYYLVLLLYVVLVLVVHVDPRVEQFRYAVPFLFTYLPEVPVARYVASGGMPFGVSWSLGIEEKFYLVWPALAFVLLRGRRHRWLVALALACVFTLLGAARLVPGWQYLNGYGPILTGATMALLLHDPTWYRRLRLLGHPTVLLAVATVTAVAVTLRFNEFLPVFTVPVALLVAGLVIIRPVLIGRMCWRPLVHVGRVSYALYLTHQLGLQVAYRLVPEQWGQGGTLVTFGLGLALALAASQVLHVLVEQPLIRVGRRLSARTGADGPTTVAVHAGSPRSVSDAQAG